MFAIIDAYTREPIVQGTYDECVTWLADHWRELELGLIDIVYAESGRAASFIL